MQFQIAFKISRMNYTQAKIRKINCSQLNKIQIAVKIHKTAFKQKFTNITPAFKQKFAA